MILGESRIHRNVYVRFGGEFLKSRYSNIEMGVRCLSYSVIGSSWKDIDYIKGLPKKRTSDPTVDEVRNRQEFILKQRWLSQFTEFFTLGLMNYSGRMTAYNAIIHLNKDFVRIEETEFQIDYPSLVLSHGKLPAAKHPTLAINDGLIKLQWENVRNKYAKSDDELLFACYSPEIARAFFYIGQENRQSRKAEIKVPEIFAGQTVEVYMAFCSRDRKLASISQYLGCHVC